MPTSPNMNAMQLDIEGALESTLARMSPERPSTPEGQLLQEHDFDDRELCSFTPGYETPSRLPRTKRQPFAPMQSTPKSKYTSIEEGLPSEIEPLSIKKKTLTTRPFIKDSRLARPNERIMLPTLQKTDSYSSLAETPNFSTKDELGFTTDLVHVTETTREDVSFHTYTTLRNPG